MQTDYRGWLDRLASERRGDRLGTAALIDDAARVRAAGAMVTGVPIPLARPVAEPGCEIDVRYVDGPIGMGADTLTLDCHGRTNTHLDALNHISLDRTWHGGWAVDDASAPSVADLAAHGLVTRGVIVDVPGLRGTPWVDPDRSVTADDIERSLAATSTTFERGDALLLYMGRDQFEAAGHTYTGLQESTIMPGVGATAAEWIVEHGVSMLCWDFLDSNHPSEPAACVHLLIWAAGLLLVDNCHLAGAAAHVRATGRATGALVVAPLAVPGATGCIVHPFLLT
jgi:kynurenine formamidase